MRNQISGRLAGVAGDLWDGGGPEDELREYGVCGVARNREAGRARINWEVHNYIAGQAPWKSCMGGSAGSCSWPSSDVMASMACVASK